MDVKFIEKILHEAIDTFKSNVQRREVSNIWSGQILEVLQ